MKGSSHMVGGLITGVFLASVIKCSPIQNGEIVALTTIAARLPDVDLPTSSMGRKTWLISNPINKLFGHRGFIHSPLFVFALGYLLKTLNCPNLILYSFIFGCTNHLFLDYFTQGGIPLFYPLSKKRYRLSKKKSGGKFEKIRCLILTTIYCCFVYFFIKAFILNSFYLF